MRFCLLAGYNKSDIFFKNQVENEAERLVLDLFFLEKPLGEVKVSLVSFNILR